MSDLNTTELISNEIPKKVVKTASKRSTKKTTSKKNTTKNVINKTETTSDSGTLNLNDNTKKVTKKKTSRPSKKVTKEVFKNDDELFEEDILNNATNENIKSSESDSKNIDDSKPTLKTQIEDNNSKPISKSKSKIVKDEFKHSPNKFIAMNLDSITHKNEDLVETEDQKILHRLATIERELINKSIEYNDLKVEFHKLSQFVYKVLNNINKTPDDVPMDIMTELMVNLND